MTAGLLATLEVPIVQAPMAGGPSTPELTAAVNRGGGLGFLAGGYRSAEALAADLRRTRELTDRPFGVNLFAAPGDRADAAAVTDYTRRLQAMAQRAGAELGEPRHDDDALAAKLELLVAGPVAVVSFTFGLPEPGVIDALHAAGSEVWVTVTAPAEARRATAVGADALIVQGVEAGGHRGVFDDDDAQSELTLLAALQLIAAAVDRPLVATGSIMTGEAVAAVLVAGAAAAQLGTAYLRCDESGAPAAQKDATAGQTPTVLTRAFSGRTARGIRNRWHAELGSVAPAAYPEVHHLTSPLRAHGRRAGDPDLFNLWAGEAHELARSGSAQAITRELWAQARRALAAAATTHGA